MSDTKPLFSFLSNKSTPKVSAPSSGPPKDDKMKMLMMAVAALIIVYVAVQFSAPHPTQTVVVAPPATTPKVDATKPVGIARLDSRPISTPTMMASKNGLGGGPLVGSQSTKLGGSAFLPGRAVNVRNDRFDFHNPWPLYKPPAVAPAAPVAPTAVAPVDAAAPVAPVAPVDAAVPVAPVAPVAPVGAPMSRRPGASNFGGFNSTRHRSPTDVIIETRDGLIIQPRA